MRRSANTGGHRKAWKDEDMNFRTTAIVAGLAAALGTGAAFAQSYSDSPPSSQQAPYARHHGQHHGVLALIREEVSAGRISRDEGAALEQRIKAMKAERRAQRQARYQGMQGGYGQGNYPPSSQPQ
jgi:transposase